MIVSRICRKAVLLERNMLADKKAGKKGEKNVSKRCK